MAPPTKLVSLDLLLTIVTAMMIMIMSMNLMSVGATWCVARSNAGPQQLLSALNYACANGADCGPIRPGGSCYMPNTIQNHASYAFDSYFRRRGGALSACNFGGTATIAVTNPSFGRCNYPVSLRSATAVASAKTVKMLPANDPNAASLNPGMNER